MTPPLIACVGGGTMASIIVSRCVAVGVISAEQWLVAEPDRSKRDGFERAGVRTVDSASELLPLLSEQAQVLLAVKPQSLESVAASAPSLGAGRVVISILAGTPTARIEALLAGCRAVRAMPNTAARVSRSCTAIALGAGARAGDEELSMRVFKAIGPVVERIDEGLMDAFTAVAGSGPAYVFYLAEVMTRAAIALGFDAGFADRVVREVIAGSAGLLASGDAEPPATLRAAVTSKGGTTEAACRVLDAAGVSAAFERALTAARDRGRELADSR